MKIGKVEMKRDIRQGCINIYFKEIFKRCLENTTEGTKINDELKNNIKYAEDSVVSMMMIYRS